MKSRKIICFIFALLCVFNLSACEDNNIDVVSAENESFIEEEISAWITYWDTDRGIKELSKINDKFSSISVFALCFNEDGSLYTPKSVIDKYTEISELTDKKSANLYICAVNDVIDENGSAIKRDTGIVRKIMENASERTRHINDLIFFAEKGGYAGIEINYEKIEESVWPDFVLFCEELSKRCAEKKLGLRIILEPKAPVDRYKLPMGSEYVIKAYDLYGESTEPGPKADVDFIKELSIKTNNMPGKKWIAFSTGGFDWQTEGSVKEVSETEAIDLVNLYGCLPARDEKSGCLYFYYTDGNGKEHTVWYADDITLNLWKKTASDCGYKNVCLWRLGGNVFETLEDFGKNEIE